MAQVIFWSALPNNFALVQRYLGPYQLSSWLEQHDVTTQVIDFTVSGPSKKVRPETIFRETKKFITKATQCIGISTTFFNSYFGSSIPENLIEAMNLVRQDYPQIKFVLGGNKAEQYGPEITKLFDAVVVGLAEDVFLNLINYWKTGKNEPKKRRPLNNAGSNFYYNDDVVDKTFDIQTSRHKWRDRDLIMPGEALPLELSRGCIFKCKFCQYPLLGRSKYDYTRSMDCVREELVDNYERWGTTTYFVLDDTMNDTVQKITEFHAMTQTLPFKIRYGTYLRADLLHRFPETIPMLKESGLIGAHFGIETLHTEASKAIGKAWSGKQAKEFLPKLIHEDWNDEVSIHCSMICGLPGETEQSLIESRDWLIENRIPSWNFKPLGITRHDQHIFTSEFSKNADQYGYTHPRPEEPFYWENTIDGWNWEKAKSFAKVLNRGKRGKDGQMLHVIYDSWSVVSLLTLGYKYEDLITKPRGQLDREELRRRRDIWIKSYHLRLLRWPDQDESYWREEFDTIFNSDHNGWLDPNKANDDFDDEDL